MDVKAMQFLNAELLIIVRLFGKLTEARPVHCSKVLLSMTVTASGMVTEVRVEQLMNAFSSIAVTL